MACSEYTLPREEEASQPKGWIQGNTKIGFVLEVATSYLHGKYGVEIRIWSLNRDNTHSWVRISHGSNRFVINLNNNEDRNSRSSARRRTWTILNQGNILSPNMKYRTKLCIFFVIHNMCIERKMEQFISGESKKIFRISSHTLLIGLTVSGKYAWQEEEEIREDSSTALILQE